MANAVKCLKINDEIQDPNTGRMISGICVTIKSQESLGSDGNGNNNFSTIENYYYSESTLDAGNQPLNWTSGLNYRILISCTDAELAGENSDPKYANQLFYDKLKIALEAIGYEDVEEIFM